MLDRTLDNGHCPTSFVFLSFYFGFGGLLETCSTHRLLFCSIRPLATPVTHSPLMTSKDFAFDALLGWPLYMVIKLPLVVSVPHHTTRKATPRGVMRVVHLSLCCERGGCQGIHFLPWICSRTSLFVTLVSPYCCCSPCFICRHLRLLSLHCSHHVL